MSRLLRRPAPARLACLTVALPAVVLALHHRPGDDRRRPSLSPSQRPGDSSRRNARPRRSPSSIATSDSQPGDAEALLLRATAQLMEGDSVAGRRDLEKALAADPALRQGWLTLGALAVAERSWDEALVAFRRAEALEPEAADNDLNIGAVELLAGDLEAASRRFARYLEGGGADANGYYLVAKNYALAGYEALDRRAPATGDRARRAGPRPGQGRSRLRRDQVGPPLPGAAGHQPLHPAARLPRRRA
jgi:tetratricopeptide (TPR) repeat protein